MSNSAQKTYLEIGDTAADGTIYAGISPSSGKAMYVAADKPSSLMDFNAAAQYAKNLDAQGHKDWRLPTDEELKHLYRNRDKGALKTAFNSTIPGYASVYWSGDAENSSYAKGVKFDSPFGDGGIGMLKDDACSARCVRSTAL